PRADGRKNRPQYGYVKVERRPPAQPGPRWFGRGHEPSPQPPRERRHDRRGDRDAHVLPKLWRQESIEYLRSVESADVPLAVEAQGDRRQLHPWRMRHAPDRLTRLHPVSKAHGRIAPEQRPPQAPKWLGFEQDACSKMSVEDGRVDPI